MPHTQLASSLPRRHDAAPRRLCSLHTPGPEMDAMDAVTPSPELPRVLLVENDPSISSLLAKTLAAHYHVETVTNGFAAWQSARGNPPALVVIGMYISGTDKLALTRTLRAGLERPSLPIVLLTASAARELLLCCLAAGASNFLLRPFSMDEFLACVRLELDLRTPSPERR